MASISVLYCSTFLVRLLKLSISWDRSPLISPRLCKSSSCWLLLSLLHSNTEFEGEETFKLHLHHALCKHLLDLKNLQKVTMTTTAAKRTKQSRPSRTFTLVPEPSRTEVAVTQTVPIMHVGPLYIRVCLTYGRTDRPVPVWGSSTMSSVLLWVTLLS